MKFNRLHGVLLGGIILFGCFIYFVEKSNTQTKRNAEANQTRNCQSNLKAIGLAIMQYARDYDENFPRHNDWMEALEPYAMSRNMRKTMTFSQLMECPQENTGYAMNRFYSKLSLQYHDSSEKNPLVYDSTTRKSNASDYGTSWPTKPTHRIRSQQGVNVLFADGHVKLMPRKPVFKMFR